MLQLFGLGLRVRLRLASWSSCTRLLDQSKLHGGYVTKGKHLPVDSPGRGDKHSPLKCLLGRDEHGRTLTPPPPRTVGAAVQARSISRSFMALPSNKRNHLQMPLVAAAHTLHSSASGSDEHGL